ncbi:MAG: tetratricopeptide repeat protein [Halorhodospira sp.]
MTSTNSRKRGGRLLGLALVLLGGVPALGAAGQALAAEPTPAAAELGDAAALEDELLRGAGGEGEERAAGGDDPGGSEASGSEEGRGEAAAGDAADVPGFQRRPSGRDDRERARVLLAQAQTHLQAGRVADAARGYRQAVYLDPQLHPARYGYARVMAAAGRDGHARRILRIGLEHAPGHVPMARLYAALAAEAGDTGTAVAALEQAREARETPPAALDAQLAALYRARGQHEQALARYQALAEAQPDEGRWQAGLALAAEGSEQTEQALAAWERVVDDEALPEAVRRYAETRLESLREGAL